MHCFSLGQFFSWTALYLVHDWSNSDADLDFLEEVSAALGEAELKDYLVYIFLDIELNWEHRMSWRMSLWTVTTVIDSCLLVENTLGTNLSNVRFVPICSLLWNLSDVGFSPHVKVNKLLSVLDLLCWFLSSSYHSTFKHLFRKSNLGEQPFILY